MLVTKTDPVEKQKDPFPKRFHYVDEAHQAACIIQKMVRDRRRRAYNDFIVAANIPRV